MTDDEYDKIVPNGRDEAYGEGFMKFLELDHGWSSWLLGQILWLMFKPKSAVEFGCGTGAVLASLMERGVNVRGYDNSAATKEFAARLNSELPSCITQADLAGYVKADLSDLAISIEVLEHLPEEAAPLAVKSIADAAPLAVITACPPIGRNPLHLNEQPFEYWMQLFLETGMQLDSICTSTLRAVFRGFYTMHEGGQLPVIPAWLFSDYIGVFRR